LAKFGKHVEACNQCHTICSISAHWQNVTAKCYIGIITNHAHTMLLHAMNLWPEIITANFWTFEVKHAIWLHNMWPNADCDNKCPYKLFTSEMPPHHLLDFCVFGCPVYILEKNLADNNGIPKWKACSYHGIYIGHSGHHASNVVLVWNPLKKLVSPQYHVIFNEEFTTVSPAAQDNHEHLDIAFQELLSACRWWHSDQFGTTTKHDTEPYYFERNWPPEHQPQQKCIQIDPHFLPPLNPSEQEPVSNVSNAIYKRSPHDGIGTLTLQVSISDVPMLKTKGVCSITSGSSPDLPTASQESVVPVSQLQQPSIAEPNPSDHLPPNIISQLGFPNFGPPKNDFRLLLMCPHPYLMPQQFILF